MITDARPPENEVRSPFDVHFEFALSSWLSRLFFVERRRLF